MATRPQDAPATGSDAGADAVVELAGIQRRYRRGPVTVEALRDVDLRVERGEFVALVGPSGCGKSTLLNVVAGVDRPDGGSARVCGVDVTTADESALTELRRHHVGVVFQAFHLLPNLTASENVALPLALAGNSDPERVDALLGRVGLAGRRTHYPAELSGGEEQRVAIARALVHRPRLIVADEPTGNLDSANGREVLELLREVARDEGVALLVATHDATVAAGADRIVTLRDGRVVSAGGAPEGSSDGSADGASA